MWPLRQWEQRTEESISAAQGQQDPNGQRRRRVPDTREAGHLVCTSHTRDLQGASLAGHLVAEDQWVHGVRQRPLPLAGTPSAVLRPPSSSNQRRLIQHLSTPSSASLAEPRLPTTPPPPPAAPPCRSCAPLLSSVDDRLCWSLP